MYMKRLLVAPLVLGLSSPANAGIYYYPSYQGGIEVRCKDGKPKHFVEVSKAGRGMKLKGYGDNQYSWPIIYIYPEASDDNYKYFPSTTSVCSYRKLNEEEKKSLILKAFKTCVGTEGTPAEILEIREKYCFGWN